MAEAKAKQKIEGLKTRQLRAIVDAHRADSKKLSTVDMKGAVQAVIASVKEYFSGAKEILLEDVELEQGCYVANAPGGTPGSPTFIKDPSWRVVISFKLGEPGTLSDVMGGDPRLYREIYIDPSNGLLRSMGNLGEMSTYEEILIDKYKTKGILIDANLALLYLMGNFNLRLVGDGKFNKLSSYKTEDFNVLLRLKNKFKKAVTTPRVLMEVSNLVNDLPA